MQRTRRMGWPVLAVCLGLLAGLRAQESSRYAKFVRPPDVIDARYGPYERNVLDLWKAPADEPTPLLVYFHGGGFRAGDKTSLAPALLELCLKEGISVAAANYRLSNTASYPAFMHDGARAIQYLRFRSREWNIDPERVAATGGSAGAGISLWIGYHDDMQDRSNSDPVLRQSSRISAMAVFGAQTTYDPRVIAKIIGEAAARHPALEPMYGLYGPERQTERAFRLFEDASPITHLTAGDPPAFLYYQEPDGPLPPDAKPGQGIHHPEFGRYLKRRADPLGVRVILRHKDDYAGDARAQVYREIVEFLRETLPAGRQQRH